MSRGLAFSLRISPLHSFSLNTGFSPPRVRFASHSRKMVTRGLELVFLTAYAPKAGQTLYEILRKNPDWSCLGHMPPFGPSPVSGRPSSLLESTWTR